MEPVYAALATRWAALPGVERQRLTTGWQSFNLDEYVGLGRQDPGSFATEMEGRLVKPLGLSWKHVGLPDGLAPDPVAEAHRYGATVLAAGGIGLQLLGLGLNGHVGFNEPPCEAHQPCHSLRLSDDTRAANAGAFGGEINAVPEMAITLGMADILAAERIVLVVTGSAKATVLQRLLNEPPNRSLPASWLQHHPVTQVIVDRAAWNGA
jgi:glucosamine-6-phosphate deaminase